MPARPFQNQEESRVVYGIGRVVVEIGSSA